MTSAYGFSVKKRLLLALTRAGADKCKFVSYFLELLKLSENVGSVFGSFNGIVFVDDVALLIDDECPAHRRDTAGQCVSCSGDFAFDGSAVSGGDSKKLGDVSVNVGKEGEVKTVGFLEEFQVVNRIAADSDYYGI